MVALSIEMSRRMQLRARKMATPGVDLPPKVSTGADVGVGRRRARCIPRAGMLSRAVSFSACQGTCGNRQGEWYRIC